MDNMLKIRKKSTKSTIKKSSFHQFVFDRFWEKAKDSEYTTSSLIYQLSQETGLSEPWINKFIYDKGGSPSVDKLECFYEAITGKQLSEILK